MVKLFDCHAHLGGDEYSLDFDEVINNAIKNNIKHIANCSDSFEMFEPTLKLKELYPKVCLCCLGIHPEFALNNDEYIKKSISFIKEHMNMVDAIGEVGLDFYWDNKESTKIRQIEIFNLMCDLAIQFNKPIVIHARNAEKETLEILKSKKIKTIYMHCYEGNYELAKEYLKLNPSTKFGVNGILTFKNALNIKELYSKLPIKNIVLETDSPLLSPVPFRGKRNEPKNVRYVFDKLLELRKENEEELENILYNSSLELYGIKE